MLKLHNPQIVFFMETKLCGKKIERVRQSCGFQNGIEVAAEARVKWRYTGFYGSPYVQDMNEAWEVLKSLITVDEIPWFGILAPVLRGKEESSLGTLLQKLENLKKGMSHWAGKIQVSRRRRQILIDKLAELLDNDKDEENMAEMIDTRIQLNFKIEKDERFWE
ncbi:reverse transcriptase [Gossypium australe]|uniref:Reverse transcriptase n=1 Tax=Gossypium australe TaxID=47621 RepID=A0A5B6VFJ6_9ROSI|nr:reverse transcriptase [Gossypium australe]